MTRLLSFESRETRRKRATVAAANNSAIIDQYAAVGLRPVYADPNQEMLVSLPLLLSLGWQIEEVGGRNVLLRPTGEQEAGER